MERILAKLVTLSKDLTANQSLELVFDGRTEHLTFYKVIVLPFFLIIDKLCSSSAHLGAGAVMAFDLYTHQPCGQI